MSDLSRRELLTRVGAAGLAARAVPGTSKQVVAQSTVNDWPQFGSSPRNTSHAPEITAPSSPDQQWALETDNPVYSSPAVADGTVFVGSWDNHLYAIDMTTGDQQWAFDARDRVFSSPAVVNGTVFVGSGEVFRESEISKLYAVDAGTGNQQWAFNTGGAVSSSPAVADGTVFVGSRDGTLYAVDAATGEQQWAFETGEAVSSSPAVADGTVFVGSFDGNLYAVDAATGDQRWAFKIGERVHSSPAVADGTVFVGSHDNNLYAVDMATGNQQWAFATDDIVWSSPAVTDEMVFVGSRDGTVYAVDAATGEQQWAFDTGRSVRSSPAVANGTVLIGSYDTRLYAVDAATGNEQWAFKTGSFVHSSPAVTDEMVLVGSRDATLYAISDNTTATSTQSETKPESEPETQSETKPESEPETQPESEPETQPQTKISTPSSDATGDDGLPAEAFVGVGGATGLGLLALLYRVRSGNSNDDGDDNSPSPTSLNGDSDDSPPTSISRAGVTHQASRQDSLSTASTSPAREGTPSGPPETVSSPSSRSLDYAEIKKGERVDTGGNADVYEAWLPDGDRIALKEPRMEGTVAIEEVEQIVEEAEVWAKLDDHEHIVGVIDYGADPVPWVGLEYMDGGDLSAVIARELPLAARKCIAVSICQAVWHAHRRGVAHLDLKPANVLFRANGDGWPIPKVGDWGLAKMLLNHSQSVEGFSPAYAAPEQFGTEEYGAVDDITDIYQVGAVCYELFTGEPPFAGSHAEVMRSVLDESPPTPSSVATMPAELDKMLLKALQKDKADRYESIIRLRNRIQTLPDEV